ncbi:hypothetical protein FG386_002251 [Cryptosporidium ryanae]|uniref:uncharacterized protein n=1 Tax=Cryptosporidium ryanae TaxID=515981 RepID=UPI00351A2782|nr:hypothetical protein FG386_002251 [Cryptosporidium ryanae]
MEQHAGHPDGMDDGGAERSMIARNKGVVDSGREGSAERSVNPSQYYVDLFYSQLAYSYFESLYLLSLKKSLNGRCSHGCSLRGGSNVCPDFDSLYYLSNSGIKNALGVCSDRSKDYGPQTRLTNSVFFRDCLNQVLLAQFYDSFVEVPAVPGCDVTTEFSLIGDYECSDKAFSYPSEKKYSINPWERYHVSILIRAIFVFVFFDVSKELYIILISLYFLYVRGFFDGIQELFERISSNHPMEATLADLRRRRAELELETAQRVENETAELVETNIDTKDGIGEVDVESKAAEEAAYGSEEPEQVDEFPGSNRENLSPEEVDDCDIRGPELNEEVDGSSNTQQEKVSSVSHEKDDINNKENKRMNYYFIVLYQTVGMYILTLMPWWNPDPTYLI